MAGSTSISFCMINRDGAAMIKDCLDSVSRLADELIVVDTGSKDESAAIARDRGAKVIFRKWTDDFSASRNAYLEAARCSWILSLDSDEFLGPCDKAALSGLLRRHPNHAFRSSIRNYFRLREFDSGLAPSQIEARSPSGLGMSCSRTIRLFPNRPGIRYCYPVHESLVPSLRAKKIPIVPLKLPIHHLGLVTRRTGLESKLTAYERLSRAKARSCPGLHRTWLELGKLLLAQNRFGEAADAFRHCLKLRPESGGAIYHAASAQFQRGWFEECHRLVEAGLSKRPRDPDLVYLHSLLKYRAGDFYGALEGFIGILESHPVHYASCVLAGACYLGLGELDLAETILSRAISMAPESEEPYLLLARVFEQRSDSDGSMRILRAGLDAVVKPQLLDLYLRAAKALEEKGRDREQKHGEKEHALVLS